MSTYDLFAEAEDVQSTGTLLSSDASVESSALDGLFLATSAYPRIISMKGEGLASPSLSLCLTPLPVSGMGDNPADDDDATGPRDEGYSSGLSAKGASPVDELNAYFVSPTSPKVKSSPDDPLREQFEFERFEAHDDDDDAFAAEAEDVPRPLPSAPVVRSMPLVQTSGLCLMQHRGMDPLVSPLITPASPFGRAFFADSDASSYAGSPSPSPSPAAAFLLPSPISTISMNSFSISPASPAPISTSRAAPPRRFSVPFVPVRTSRHSDPGPPPSPYGTGSLYALFDAATPTTLDVTAFGTRSDCPTSAPAGCSPFSAAPWDHIFDSSSSTSPSPQSPHLSSGDSPPPMSPTSPMRYLFDAGPTSAADVMPFAEASYADHHPTQMITDASSDIDIDIDLAPPDA
ncbi:hypothetical protein BDK51DRAFT_34380, partial [Blyttiomyces helicus]